MVEMSTHHSSLIWVESRHFQLKSQQAFVESNELILKWKCTEPRPAETILTKNKVGGLAPLNSRLTIVLRQSRRDRGWAPPSRSMGQAQERACVA